MSLVLVIKGSQDIIYDNLPPPFYDIFEDLTRPALPGKLSSCPPDPKAQVVPITKQPACCWVALYQREIREREWGGANDMLRRVDDGSTADGYRLTDIAVFNLVKFSVCIYTR